MKLLCCPGASVKGVGVRAPILSKGKVNAKKSNLLISESMLMMSGGIMNSRSKLS